MATLNGNVTSDGGASSGVTDRGFVYKTSAGVTLADNKTTVLGTTGPFTLSPSLAVNTQYFFDAYATNSIGTTLSSPELNFWTLANPPTVPTVGNPTSTTLAVAIGSGDGNPTATTYAIYETSQSKFVQASGALGTSAVFQTAAIWGTKTVTGLTGGNTYTFQVEAQNGATTPVITSYGPTASGTTSLAAPTVTTGTATAITNTTATLGGNITATGGANATERGFYYSTTSGFADGAGTKVSSTGSYGVAAYTLSVIGLTPGTAYYFKAFATNSAGTSYGGQATFSTLQSFAGTYNVGTGAPTYPTLKSFFDAVNAGIVTGNVTVNLVGDCTETATASLNQWVESPANSNYTMLVQPSGGAARTISGNLALPLIDLNGADRVTFDGLNSGANALTISNTSASTTSGTSTIRFINGATSDTITRCSVQGSATMAIGTNGGTIYFATDGSTANGNDNDTISLCNIGPAGTSLPSKAIYASGSSTSQAIENSGVIIDSNNIFDFFNAAQSVTGINILTGNDNWTISNNKFYQTATRSFTGSGLRYSAITLNSTTGTLGAFTVTGNIIGFGAADGTGTTTINGSSNDFRGIDAPSVNLTTATSIQGNTISGINQSTSRSSASITLSAFIGISVGAVDGLFNVGDVVGNTVGSLDNSSSITINGTSITSSTAPAVGIFNYSYQNANISNNNVGSISIPNTGTVLGFRGIYSFNTTGVIATINNNVVANVSDAQVGSYAVYGIQVGAANASITGNTVRNLGGASTAANLIISAGITTSGSTGVNTISRNTVYALSNASGAASNSVYGISLSLPSTANIVERNFIHSLSMTSSASTGQIWGISDGPTGTADYRNNMIRLGVDATGASITNGYSIVGIRNNTGTTNNFYHNSVYIGGAGVVAASSTYCFLSDVITVARKFQDNIFWNARGNTSSTVSNYALAVGGTSANPAGLTSNYNDLYATGVGGAIGTFNGTNQITFANWRSATGQDANSFSGDPNFINAAGASTVVDLHVQAPTPIESAGTNIATVTNDYDGQLRSALSPVDVGADAGNFQSTNANLANLVLSAGTLSPSFSAGTFTYTLNVPNSTASTTVTPTVADSTATVTVNGTPVASGNASGAISLSVGSNTITTVVTAQDGSTTRTYTVTVTRARANQTITFNPIPAKTYGDAAFDPGATASSGLAVSYVSSNPAVATVSGSTITIVGAGTSDITASQAGDSNYNAAANVTQTLTVNKATPIVTATPTASAITYGQTLSASTLSGGTANVPGSFAFTTPSTAPNAGTVNQSVTFTPTDAANYNPVTLDVSVTVNPKMLAPGDITITSNNGTFSASSPGVSGFTLTYIGYNGTTYGPSTVAPVAAGNYTVTATSADPNYTGSKSLNYYLAGPIAANDNVTKPANNARFKIPVAALLANDSRIDANGVTQTTGLTITAVQNGSGAATLTGSFVFFTPSSAATDTFTYTLSDGNGANPTSTGTVSVASAVAQTFTLDLLRVVSPPTFLGGNTSVTVEFAGVPDQTYNIEYSTTMSAGSWVSVGPVSTGSTGSFNVTVTASGDQTSNWSSLFFRATR